MSGEGWLTADNDPRREHDFGRFTHYGRQRVARRRPLGSIKTRYANARALSASRAFASAVAVDAVRVAGWATIG